MFVRSVKNANSSSYWSSLSYLYLLCMFSDKEKLLYLWTELSKSQQECPSTKPSHYGVKWEVRVVAVNLLQMCVEQSSLKKSRLFGPGNFCCNIHYLSYVQHFSTWCLLVYYAVVIQEVGKAWSCLHLAINPFEPTIAGAPSVSQ